MTLRFEIPTWSGRRWNLLDPQATDVSFVDIAEHLARICRSSGAMDPFWSVASHSVLVGDILGAHLGRDDLRPYGLLHDAHEAYVGDRTQPLRRLEAYLASNTAGGFATIVEKHDIAIHAAARLRWPLAPADEASLRYADALAWATEKRQFLRLRDWAGTDEDREPLPIALTPVTIPEAASALRRGLADLGIGS